ncbi:MAG: Gfo/Idh/MocA family oxidoreductase, partial [Planctomycetales bacterium]|nr:Gfo/Idh/MocA family oxidoreductase [Planctomycetales bacterium]
MKSHAKQIRLGLIGCGAIAEVYHLPALVAEREVRNGLILVDPNQERLRTLGAKFGITRWAADYRDIVNDVDGVIIAAPPALHHPVSVYFLARSIPVLCEKPLADSVEEARDMVDVAERQGVQLA